MAEVIDRFVSNEDMGTWRDDHRIMEGRQCTGYTGYLVKPEKKQKVLHTAKCQNSAPDVEGTFTNWMASEDRDQLIARADELYSQREGYKWVDCGHCVEDAGSLEQKE